MARLDEDSLKAVTSESAAAFKPVINPELQPAGMSVTQLQLQSPYCALLFTVKAVRRPFDIPGLSRIHQIDLKLVDFLLVPESQAPSIRPSRTFGPANTPQKRPSPVEAMRKDK